MILFKVYVFVGFLSVLKAQIQLMPNLPLGEYRIIFRAIYRTKDLPFKINEYLSKKSINSTEMRGNFSLDIPFEDSYTGSIFKILDANFASWSLIGGWKPNSIVNGTYESSEFDKSLYNDNNFPKEYFYGKYKFIGKIKDKKYKQLACIVAEMSAIRPWESLMD
ncbi:uncharacterized protein LOC111034397 [Myzus persicae]|uniref:uncharacterized protein LOC111034397 n=1 Tax=Myzus persicae TaxID=13164 RepID=UPI000B9339DB|nr:uncharacterized protein LOC111034397 [Myzus persicae]